MAKQKRDSEKDREAQLEADVYAAVRSLGWALPTSSEEVRAAAADLNESSVTLPERLADPFASIDRAKRLRVIPGSRTAAAPRVSEDDGYARAARGGGEPISPEFEARMRRDRLRAEAKGQGGDEHG